VIGDLGDAGWLRDQLNPSDGGRLAAGNPQGRPCRKADAGARALAATHPPRIVWLGALGRGALGVWPEQVVALEQRVQLHRADCGELRGPVGAEDYGGALRRDGVGGKRTRCRIAGHHRDAPASSPTSGASTRPAPARAARTATSPASAARCSASSSRPSSAKAVSACPDVKVLLIREGPEGFFLERLTEDGGSAGDTQHDTLDEAMRHAYSEYDSISNWRFCPDDVDPLEYIRAPSDS
jgi:hypothetical protein